MRINEQLGLRRAGKRAMMKLPGRREEAIAITAAICPACGQRYAIASQVRAGWLWCGWCAHRWNPTR